MTDLYKYLSELMPIKRVMISLAMGILSMIIVIVSGKTNVRLEILVSRVITAFSYSTMASFIAMMSCEELAIMKTEREYERFIDEAKIEECEEKFNREEYLRDE